MIDELQQHLSSSHLLPAGSHLIVAVSGGVDSVSLLDLLDKLRDRWGWHITVAHLDHNLRGESSEEAQLVGRLSQQYGYPFYMNQLTDPEDSEASLRRARYDFLESVRAGLAAEHIVTAHHADDKIETSIFNAIRGADRYGLTALKPVQGYIVRPLLPYAKGKLITYAHTRELLYRNDPSNDDISYSRNFVRHVVLPHTALVDPQFRSRYLQQLNYLEELTTTIDWHLAGVLDLVATTRSGGSISLNRKVFLALPPLVQNNLLGYIVRTLTGGVGLSSRNLYRALKFMRSAVTGTETNAIPHLIITRVYDSFEVALIDSATVVPLPTEMLRLDNGVQTAGYRVNLISKPQPTDQPNYLVKPGKLYIRGWQAGDRIAPIGMEGHRKLQDIFIDKKIPRLQRQNWPIVVDAQNQPVWVVDLCFSRAALAHPGEPHHQLTAQKVDSYEE